MPHSKDPDRYDPSFGEVLSYMEEGQLKFSVNCKAPTRALSFKMRLYGYAEAWKAEGFKLAKVDPERSKMCFQRAKTMARYKLRNEGNFVIAESRDDPDFETFSITVETKAQEHLPTAEIVQATALVPTGSKPLVPKEQMSKENKNFLDLLESVDKQEHTVSPSGPVAGDRESITGEDDSE